MPSCFCDAVAALRGCQPRTVQARTAVWAGNARHWVSMELARAVAEGNRPEIERLEESRATIDRAKWQRGSTGEFAARLTCRSYGMTEVEPRPGETVADVAARYPRCLVFLECHALAIIGGKLQDQVTAPTARPLAIWLEHGVAPE